MNNAFIGYDRQPLFEARRRKKILLYPAQHPGARLIGAKTKVVRAVDGVNLTHLAG